MPFASFDPASSSWRTSQLCLLEEWSEYSETWPRSGTMRSGTAYLRPASAHLTAATAFSLSRIAPTLTAMAFTPTVNDSKNATLPPSQAGRNSLIGQLTSGALLPTPRTSDVFNESASRLGTMRGQLRGIGLLQDQEARMLPTPAARDWEDCGAPSELRRKSPGIATFAKHLLPTPIASDVRDRGNMASGNVQRRIEKGKQVALGQRAGGALNPTWVEWLMGFPTEWTASDASATR
jgi:hypothetical protein